MDLGPETVQRNVQQLDPVGRTIRAMSPRTRQPAKPEYGPEYFRGVILPRRVAEIEASLSALLPEGLEAKFDWTPLGAHRHAAVLARRA